MRQSFQNKQHRHLAFGVLCGFLLTLLVRPAHAQYALFTKPTDTISVSGTVDLNTAATYEAWVLLASTGDSTNSSRGIIFNEWVGGSDDKLLSGTVTSLAGYAYPLQNDTNLFANVLIDPVFHHLAYVYDGSQERLYLDGNLIASRLSTGSIDNDSGAITTVGAIFRDNHIASAFAGYIDTLRISNVARYSGNSFTPPTGNLPADANTLLLYKFDAAAGATTIEDLSGNGHTGTLGTGFTGATSPIFGAVPPFTVTIAPHILSNGQAAIGTVTLTSPAPAGGAVVALKSSSANATAPKSLSIAAGATSATFPITGSHASKDTSAVITASYANVSLEDPIVVTSASLSSITATPASVLGGKALKITVGLSQAASANETVALTSSDPSIPVPASVVVPSGAKSATVSVNTLTVTQNTSVTLTASFGGATRKTTVTVTAPTVSALTVSPSTVAGGANITGHVTLNSAAPTGGTSVALASDSTTVSLPATVTVPAGTTTVAFTGTTTAVTTSTTAHITATLNGATKSATLQVTPDFVLSLKLTPNPAKSQSVMLATLTLAVPAPTGGLTITLQSDQAFVTPGASTVFIPAGQTVVYATVYTSTVTTRSTANLTATVNGLVTSAIVTVTP